MASRHYIQSCRQQGHSQAINDVDIDIVTGQSGNAHVLTVGMGNDVFLPQYLSRCTRKMNGKHTIKLLTTAAMPIFPMAEEVRSQCISVDNRWPHSGQMPWPGEWQILPQDEMYEEHLGYTATKGYVHGVEPEDGQHLGSCGCGEQDIC